MGLAWNHQDWRFFDPQLLRWHSVDPELENGQEAWTPYAFGFDNALRYSDANGRQGVPVTTPGYAAHYAEDIRALPGTIMSAISTWINAPIGQDAQAMGRGLMISSTGEDVTPKTRGTFLLAALGQAAGHYVGPVPGRFYGKQNLPTRVRPQGVSKEAFVEGSALIRSKAGHISEDIVVQGSRAAGTARADSDIDIAVKVTPEHFDSFVQSRFGNPNPGSAKERSKQYSLREGRVAAGEAGFRTLRQEAANAFGVPKADISIIRKGGNFDNGAQIPLK